MENDKSQERLKDLSLKEYIIPGLNMLLEEIKTHPTFSLLDHIEFKAFKPDPHQTRIQLDLVIYGGSMKYYRDHLDAYLFRVEDEIDYFRTYLMILFEHVEIPFNKIPLHLPLKAMPHRSMMQKLINARLRIGI